MKPLDTDTMAAVRGNANSGDTVVHGSAGQVVVSDSASGATGLKRLVSDAASIFNLFPARDGNWRKLSARSRHASAKDALAADWAAIGGDFRVAIEKVSKPSP